MSKDLLTPASLLAAMTSDILEGSQEVEVDEHGMLVQKGESTSNGRGVRLKPQTFY